MRSIAALIVVLVLPAAAQARPGDLDRSFSRDGRIVGTYGGIASVLGTVGGGITAIVGPYSPRASLRSFDPRGARRAGFPATHGKDAVAAGTGYAVLDHDFGALPGRPPRVIRVGPGGERQESFGSAGVAEVPTPAQDIWLGS